MFLFKRRYFTWILQAASTLSIVLTDYRILGSPIDTTRQLEAMIHYANYLALGNVAYLASSIDSEF